VQDAETGILEHLNESSCFEKVKHIWADCGRSRGFNNKRIERSVSKRGGWWAVVAKNLADAQLGRLSEP
jgi:hypothetical protein